MNPSHSYLTSHNYTMHIPNIFLDVVQFDFDNTAEIGRTMFIVPDCR